MNVQAPAEGSASSNLELAADPQTRQRSQRHPFTSRVSNTPPQFPVQAARYSSIFSSSFWNRSDATLHASHNSQMGQDATGRSCRTPPLLILVRIPSARAYMWVSKRMLKLEFAPGWIAQLSPKALVRHTNMLSPQALPALRFCSILGTGIPAIHFFFFVTFF